MKRRYIEVDGRRVMYRRAGNGPPLVMLHGSPANSDVLAHEMAAASEHFTCFALDTPGFGGSDPLPGDVLEVNDLARATAAAMRALGLPPCPIYGTHTGAVIAIEVGVGWPECTTGLVLEGLPIFTDDEIAAIFPPAYFAPMVADPLAGHLVQTWVRFRDQFTWFPWPSRDVKRLNPVDRPTPQDIHHWVMMFYRSCRTYGPAYRAACFNGQRARVAAEKLTLPAIYMASAEDMLFSHLERLPPMKDGQRIVRLPHDPQAKPASIVELALSLPAPAAFDLAVPTTPAGQNPALQFIDAPACQLFVRCYGDRAAPAVVLLHDAPGSGLAMREAACAIADRLYVIVPDLPGNGDSDNPTGSVIAASGEAVVAIADALCLSRYAVAGVGCGATVAASMARLDDPRICATIVERLPEPDDTTASKIAPELPLSPDGTHWLTAWLMIRDAEIYRPWFDGRVSAQRPVQGNFDAWWLHDQTHEIMKARTSYHRLAREAYRFDSAAALSRSASPVVVAPEGGLASTILATLAPGVSA